jgi:hypothetical protein
MNQIDEWVCAEFANLAQVINDYDHNLFLEMVPVEEQHKLIDKSKIFRVVDDRTKTIVLYASSLSRPQDILARLWSMDQNHNNVVANVDAQNAAVQALEMNKRIEEMEAQKDFVTFLANNTKSRWVHEGRVRDEHFRDLGPVKTVIDK